MNSKKYTVGIITLSDKGSAGKRPDQSGPLIKQILMEDGHYSIHDVLLIPDEPDMLRDALISMCDEKKLNLILTTGGTGFSSRDITPDVTLSIATKNAPGIAEFMRYKSFDITPKAMLSRGVSVIRHRTLIINLPGSPKAVAENLSFIIPFLPHGLDILLGRDGECGSSPHENKHRIKKDDVSFMDLETSRWLQSAREDSRLCDGFCVKKFRVNIITDAFSQKKAGDTFLWNKQKYTITSMGKKCYDNCPLRLRLGKSCPLSSGVAFGKETE